MGPIFKETIEDLPFEYEHQVVFQLLPAVFIGEAMGILKVYIHPIGESIIKTYDPFQVDVLLLFRALAPNCGHVGNHKGIRKEKGSLSPETQPKELPGNIQPGISEEISSGNRAGLKMGM